MHDSQKLPASAGKNSVFGRLLPEIILLLLFLGLTSLVSAFHEPWFDEAQAWMIARDATFREILFVLPHYEGHPPLWHLILLPFAKLGAPYEWSIKVISIFIGGVSAFLLLFRSPFPRPVRMALPFTYFLFYQYCVISRPYCLLGLALLLAAMAYPARQEKPFRYVLSLGFLCLTSAYGILLAGGIAVCWLVEICISYKKQPFSALLRDRRIHALLCLLALALVLIADIMPYANAYAYGNPRTVVNSLPVRLLYALFVLPGDALLYDGMSRGYMLKYYPFSSLNLIAGSFIGIIVWGFLLAFAYRKRRFLLLLIPYLFFAVFSAVFYLYPHHIGIATLFFLYWFWVCSGEAAPARPLPAPLQGKLDAASVEKLRRYLPVPLYAVLAIQLFWSVAASVNEIRLPYSESRDVAAFIQQYHLSDATIMMSWGHQEKCDETAAYQDDPNPETATLLMPYFDENIVANFNYGNPKQRYNTHTLLTKEACTEELLSWKAIGTPDVLLGRCPFDELYPDGSVSMSDYVPVQRFDVDMLWKSGMYDVRWWYLYLRKDLLPQYGLTEIEEEPFFTVE